MWIFDLVGGGNCIVVIRVLGSILWKEGGGFGFIGEGIVSDIFIEKICFV